MYSNSKSNSEFSNLIEPLAWYRFVEMFIQCLVRNNPIADALPLVLILTLFL